MPFHLRLTLSDTKTTGPDYRISDGAWTRPLPAVYGRRIFFSGADARTHLAFFPVGPELFWQQPIESSQHAQGALLPCAFRHIATKPAPDTST
jgi:hypothetical protein